MEFYCLKQIQYLRYFHINLYKIKYLNSQEVLDLLGTLLAHLVLELQVHLGLPERKTGNGQQRWRRNVTESRRISQSMCEGELPRK